ncbi:hypothetical protein FJT64_022965 [Amphibalanus amphitrite]|uniref:Uncharacterized protein n=1 Tax=Amphibalanus amphitrite TaxID=1232801 RepID=A0A6A4WTL5_AMPAM|nr:hypothetical protein FJT64_022965 [Amphibalanus amphitrite]
MIAPHNDTKLSPNNNTVYGPATKTLSALDNRPALLPSPGENSSGDDAVSGSLTSPSAYDDASDEPMSPAERRPPSPVTRPAATRRASSLAPHPARSGKLKSLPSSIPESLVAELDQSALNRRQGENL